MSAPLRCPSCNQEVAPPAHYLGKTWRCPACREPFVPRADGSAGLGPEAGEQTARGPSLSLVAIGVLAFVGALLAALTKLVWRLW